MVARAVSIVRRPRLIAYLFIVPLIFTSYCASGVSAADTGAKNTSLTSPVLIEVPAAPQVTRSSDTKATEAAAKQIMDQSDKIAPAQAKIINKVPGVNVDPEDLQAAPIKKKKRSLNPLNWIFRPVTKLQEQSVRLEQQIVKLTGPIAALQPAMMKLEDKMGEVKDEMIGVSNGMNGVSSGMNKVNGTVIGVTKEMTHVQTKMTAIQKCMSAVQNSIGKVNGQMDKVQNTIQAMQNDIGKMRAQMGRLEQPMKDLRPPIVQLQKPLKDLSRPVSTIGARLNSLDEQLADLKNMLAMVLTSIYLAAAFIAIGTPIAAVLVWHHRKQLFPNASKDLPAPETENEKNQAAKSQSTQQARA